MADGQEIVGNNGTENKALTVRGNPDKTIPYRYKPGQSGNPGGRPKRKPIQDELEKVFEENPELARKIVYKAAIKAAQGDHKFFCEVRDMMDGKLAAPLFGAESDSTSVTLNIEVVRKKLLATTSAISLCRMDKFHRLTQPRLSRACIHYPPMTRRSILPSRGEGAEF